MWIQTKRKKNYKYCHKVSICLRRTEKIALQCVPQDFISYPLTENLIKFNITFLTQYLFFFFFLIKLSQIYFLGSICGLELVSVSYTYILPNLNCQFIESHKLFLLLLQLFTVLLYVDLHGFNIIFLLIHRDLSSADENGVWDLDWVFCIFMFSPQF